MVLGGQSCLRLAALFLLALIAPLSYANNNDNTAAPAVGLTKGAGSVVDNGDGTCSVDFWLKVRNLGAENLSQVQVEDNIAAHIAPATIVRVDNLVATGELSEVNTHFDGGIDVQMLSGIGHLNRGDFAKIDFRLTFQPPADPSSDMYHNQAVVFARGESSGTLVSGVSQSANPTPDRLGFRTSINPQPPQQSEKTPFICNPAPVAPAIGVAKEVVGIEPLLNETSRFQFTVRTVIENVGNTVLSNVVVEDDLAATLAAADAFEVSSPIRVVAGAIELNPNFDGIGERNLLGSLSGDGVTLDPGQSVTLEFDVEVELGASFGPFSNQIVAYANANNVAVTDLSDDGAIPDPNGNGIANEPGENTPTVFEFPRTPIVGSLGAAKTVEDIIQTGPDQFRLTVRSVLENLSSVTLTDVELLDDLAETFIGVDSFTVSPVTVVTGDAAANVAFNGITETNLLAAGVVLDPHARIEVEFQVEVQTTFLGPFSNQIIATATSGAESVTDLSDDGAEPDPNGNGNANEEGENDPTVFSLEPVRIGLAKALVGVTPVADSPLTYDVALRLTIENLSDSTPATSIQLTDDLTNVFPGADLTVVEPPVVTGSLAAANASYNGSSDIALLSGSETLPPSAFAQVDFTVRVAGLSGSFTNQARVVSLQEPGGTPIAEDLSDDGDEPDANGNGIANDPGEDDPTPITLPAVSEPAIGLAKSASEVLSLQAGGFTTQLTFVVTNFGDADLTNVQVTDDLAAVFGSDAVVTVGPISAGTGLVANPNYDGLSDINLLDAGASSLAIGASEQIQIDITVVPEAFAARYENFADATGTSPDGNTVTDRSTNGLTPDPNGDGTPDEDAPTPILPPPDPDASGVIAIAKQHLSSELDSDGVMQASFSLVIQNLGQGVLSNVQVTEDLAAAFPAPASVSLVGVPTVDGALTELDPAFDGTTVATMLSGNESLNPGAEAVVEFTVDVTLNGAQGPFSNQVIAVGTNPDDTVSKDRSDDGVDPDMNGDGDPGGPDEDDPTPVELPAALVGSVFEDLNLNNALDATDTLLSGWTVEVLDTQGNIVATTVTGSMGDYSFIALPPGDYVVRFRHPSNDVVWGQRPATLIENEITRVNFPVVPGGRVYDSETRASIDGVTLALVNSLGTPIADECLLPGQQNQRVSEDGSYRFDVQPGQHSSCPTSTTNYRIRIVEAPAGYRALPSIQIPPTSGALNVRQCSIDPNPEPPCVVQQQNLPPSPSEDATYYLQWDIDAENSQVANNHIPLDSNRDGSLANLVSIAKKVNKDTAVIGDLLGYEILVSNTLGTPVIGIDLLDNIPAGFQFVEGSQSLREPGPDGLLDTADDVTQTLGASGVDPVLLGPIDVASDTTVAVRYLVRVGTGVVQGEYTNTAVPLQGGMAVGNVASAAVEIVSDPLFEKTTIIGKVFNDLNENNWQDEGEVGIPGVRLATVSGLLIETDRHGRYHIADVDVPRAERGANFILKLDTATLPAESIVVSENPRVIRITQALMSKINFAVRVPERSLALTPTPRYEKTQRTTHYLDDLIDPVRFASGKSDIPDNYIAQLDRLLKSHEGRTNLRIRFSGHTDNEPLSIRAQKIYGDNLGLSQARAETVAKFVQQALSLDSDSIETVGLGPTQPIASNATREGMRLNRRVEISVVYDERVTTSEVVEEVAKIEADSVKDVLTDRTTTLEPAYFNSGAMQLTADEQQALERRLEPFSDSEVVSLSLVGYTDNAPVRPNKRYDSNEMLSRIRAQNVADHIAAKLDVAADKIVIGARGSVDATGYKAETNKVVIDRQLQQRRVEIELTYRRKTATVETTYRTIHPAPEGVAGGQLWVTEDALVTQPRMDVLALTELVVDAQGQMLDPLEFVAVSNYQQFVDEFQLELYRSVDTDLLRPIATLKQTRLNYPESFEWIDENLRFHPGERLAYVLRATRGNVADTTHARLVDVVGENKPNVIRVVPESIWGEDNLAKQNIVVEGRRVRVHGSELPPNSEISVAGQSVPVNASGKFVTELHISPGTEILVTGSAASSGYGKDNKRSWQQTLQTDEDENYSFIVGLANLSIGDHSISGDFEPLSVDDHFDESVYVDGRLAFYAKAKVKGKYLITAQMDSTEDELSNFSDNLRREDPRRIFRQLDPDRYYAVYGDDSTTVSDVDTQGAFYVRVDWDRNQALWGNFNTGLTDTEYMQYNRSLYGAQFSHKSVSTTEFGDAKRALTVFGSQAQSAAAHVTFRATGGSLYYLRHTDIVQGSEKVWVEVRQRDTQQVVERQDFIEGRDYEVDALQGRIILRSPLSQVVNDRGPAIIRSRGLEGDDVYLLVDYEYVPDAFEAEDMTYGGRAKGWLGDHVGVGVSKIVDQRSGTDFDLQGVDVTLKASQGTYLNAEVVQSEASQNNANAVSADGGLSFGSQNSVLPDDLLDGDAIAIEGRVNLADVSDSVQGDVRAWWKERDADFSAGRLRQGADINEQGIDLVIKPTDDIQITGGYAELEEEGLAHSNVARLQVDAKVGRFTVGGEVRHEDLERITTSGVTQQGDGLLAGLRVGYDLNDTQTLYGSVQSGLSENGNYRDNDLYAIGLNTQINEHAAVSVEVADGDRGHALVGGFEYSPAENLSLNMRGGVGPGAISQFSGNYRLAEGHELYGSYAVDPDRNFGERNLMTIGQRRDFGNRFGIFTESQFGKDDRYAGVSHAFGMDYTTEQDWVLSSLLQKSEDDTGPVDLERTAISIGAAVKRDAYKFSAKAEYRQDQGPTQDSDQYLLSSSYTRILNESNRLIGRVNVSWTEDEIANEKQARFVEFDIGHALRAVQDDRWNVLTKYGYFYDLVSRGQNSARPDQRVHILSTEALYAFNARWELGGKLAIKEGEVRMFRDRGGWSDYGVGLAVVRGRYHLTRAWDGVAEYRYLRDRHGDNARHGALLGVYRHVGDHLKVGIGYNFTDFSDDIRDAEYDNHGWFVDLVGKF